MATVRELTNTTGKPSRWQAIVRRAGHDLSRTFPDKKKAKRWASDVEAAISIDSPKHPFNREDWLRNTPTKKALALRCIGDASPTPTPSWTMKRALEHYRDTVSDTKASPQQEATRVRHLVASVGHVTLASLTNEDVQKHVEARKAAGKGAATIRLEVMQVRALWKHARAPRPHGWGLDLGPVHPCAGVVVPPLPPARDRRLHDEDQETGTRSEEAAIRAAILALDIPDIREVLDAWELALATGMRRGEILSLHRDEIEKTGGVWRVVKGKHKTNHHGHTRTLSLTSAALPIIHRRKAEADAETGLLFTIKVDRLRHYFRKAVRAAGARGFRFHDTRHEAISRMDEAGLSFGQLKAQSGHRSAASLARYTNAKPKDIVAKLG